MMDLALEAEGGADEAVMIFAMRLDFQVEIGWSRHGKSYVMATYCNNNIVMSIYTYVMYGYI